MNSNRINISQPRYPRFVYVDFLRTRAAAMQKFPASGAENDWSKKPATAFFFDLETLHFSLTRFWKTVTKCSLWQFCKIRFPGHIRFTNEKLRTRDIDGRFQTVVVHRNYFQKRKKSDFFVTFGSFDLLGFKLRNNIERFQSSLVF